MELENEWDQRAKVLMESLPKEWGKAPILIAHEIRSFLQSIKDEKTEIDSGTNGISGDLWVTVQDTEYFISIRKSNLQLRKEGKPIPTEST